jgi:hypothetical protein
MKKTLFILILLSFSIQLSAQIIKADPKDWQQLFNGKNLEGWKPKITNYDLNDNFGNTFRVENGLLSVRYDQYDKFNERFGHIFYKDKFSYYLIAVEYRFVDEQATGGPGWAIRNSGVMLHSPAPETMGKNQDFPISVEVQFLGGNGKDKRSTCNLCTPGTDVFMDGKLFTPHCINSKSQTYHGEQWVRAEVLVLGDSLIRHYVNGEAVIEYSKPQFGSSNVSGHNPSIKKDGMPIKEGYISLQSESHPIDFRKVEILNLVGCMNPDALNYKDYYVKADNLTCVFKKKRKGRRKGK